MSSKLDGSRWGRGMAGRVNWSRGMFRLWLVLSVMWVVLVFVLARPDQNLSLYQRLGEGLEVASGILERSGDELVMPDGAVRPRLNIEAERMRLMASQEIERRRLIASVSLAFVPPLVILTIGLLLAWAIRGFSRGGGQ